MALHGGRFANYYYKSVVTHVICDHLPDTKLKQLLKSKSATPIVRAAWISESIAAGKLLPPSQFPIERLSIHHAQTRLRDAPEQKKTALGASEVYPQLQAAADASPQLEGQEEQQLAAAANAADVDAEHDGTCGQAQVQLPLNAAAVAEAHQASQGGAERATHNAASQPTAISGAPTAPTVRYHSNDLAHTSANAELPPLSHSGGHDAQPQLPSAEHAKPTDCGQAIMGQNHDRWAAARTAPQQKGAAKVTWTPQQIAAAAKTAAAMREACDVLKGAPKSSADDPNFMATYFKASRLHFIGTWKMRIEALMRQHGIVQGAAAQAQREAASALFGAPTAKRAKKERCAEHTIGKPKSCSCSCSCWQASEFRRAYRWPTCCSICRSDPCLMLIRV